LLRRKAEARVEEHTLCNSSFRIFTMEFVDTRTARRRRAADLLSRRERRTRLFCSGIAALVFLLAASAFLLRWFTEAPPLMPQ
jgi:hypothetical protein